MIWPRDFVPFIVEQYYTYAKCKSNADNKSGLKLHLGSGWSSKNISCFHKYTTTMSQNFYPFGKNTKWQLIENVAVIKTDIVEQNPADAGSVFTMRAHAIQPPVHERQCKFWPLAEFDSPCPDICIWLCGRPRLPLRSVQGCELTHMSRTAWSVIKYLCPAAWSGKTHLDPEFSCQLLSLFPTLPPVCRADIL